MEQSSEEAKQIADKIQQDYIKSLEGKTIAIQPIKFEDYIPKNVRAYIPQNSELEILDIHLKHGKNIILEGPHGIGKTLAIAHQAMKNKIPLIQMDCSEGTKRHDLIGRFVLVGNDVSYQLGFMPTAFELANKYGFAVACLEELNALTPNMQKVLNQMLDWRNHCYVPEIHKIFQLREGAKLMICGTMNPSTYGGVFELNQDMKSRFLTMKIGFPKEAKEKEIVQSQVIVGNMSLLQQLETIAIESRNGIAKGTFSYAISTRDIIQTIEAYNLYPDALKSEAIRLGILNKFDEDGERKTMTERIRAITGVQL